MKNRSPRWAFAAASLLGAVPAQAAAPERAICAVQQAIACAPYEQCQRSLPGAMNLPVLLMIDRGAGVVLSRLESGEERSSKIGTDTGDETMHVLQGAEQGKPWSMRVELEDGHFTLTSSQPEAGYVLYSTITSATLIVLLTIGTAPAQQRTGDEVLFDAARGAAGGAIIGAFTGDAGAGAAAGAVGGALFGGMNRVAPDTPLGDGASGAARGALIGAIAGNAGKGSVTGAVGGMLMGGIRRNW